MVGFFRKLFTNPVVSPVGYAYKKFREERGKKNRREKTGRKEEKAYRKEYTKAQKAFERDQTKYNKKFAQREKAQNSRMRNFYKKYGDEDFQRHNALSGGQRGLLRQLEKQGKAGLRGMRTPEDFSNFDRRKVGKQSSRAIRDLLQTGGIEDPTQGAEYQTASNTLQNLLYNPGISDIRNDPGYQQSRQSYGELLGQSPEAYERFAAPEMRKYKSQVIPDLLARFGQGARGSSGLNAALANSGADLQERLGQLRAGLQQEGRQGLAQSARDILPGQQAAADVRGRAAQSLFPFAELPLSAQRARSGIRGQAAQTGLNYEDLFLKQQGLQNENIMGQNQQALNQAQLGLGVNPYHSIYRPPTAPTGYSISGGPEPIRRFPGMEPAPPRQTNPGFFQQLGANFIPAAATAAGAAFGGPAGAYAGNAAGNAANRFFGGNQQQQQYQQPQRQSWGFNQMGT